jgi:hypothetical protein
MTTGLDFKISPLARKRISAFKKNLSRDAFIRPTLLIGQHIHIIPPKVFEMPNEFHRA